MNQTNKAEAALCPKWISFFNNELKFDHWDRWLYAPVALTPNLFTLFTCTFSFALPISQLQKMNSTGNFEGLILVVWCLSKTWRRAYGRRVHSSMKRTEKNQKRRSDKLTVIYRQTCGRCNSVTYFALHCIRKIHGTTVFKKGIWDLRQFNPHGKRCGWWALNCCLWPRPRLTVVAQKAISCRDPHADGRRLSRSWVSQYRSSNQVFAVVCVVDSLHLFQVTHDIWRTLLLHQIHFEIAKNSIIMLKLHVSRSRQSVVLSIMRSSRTHMEKRLSPASSEPHCSRSYTQSSLGIHGVPLSLQRLESASNLLFGD